jgi:hypothetical protein
MRVPTYKNYEEKTGIIKTYKFVRKVKDNMYLYENIYNNMDRHCFTKYDLGLVKDPGIVNKRSIKEWAKIYLHRKPKK